jgi:hypothetical protein
MKAPPPLQALSFQLALHVNASPENNWTVNAHRIHLQEKPPGQPGCLSGPLARQ